MDRPCCGDASNSGNDGKVLVLGKSVEVLNNVDGWNMDDGSCRTWFILGMPHESAVETKKILET